MTQMIHGATPDAIDHLERALVLGRSASVRSFCVAAVYASILRAFRGLGHDAFAWSTRPTLGSTSSQIDGLARGSIGCVPAWSTRRETRAAATELLRRSVAASTAEGDQCAAAIAAIRLGELAELRGDYAEATSATLIGLQHVDDHRVELVQRVDAGDQARQSRRPAGQVRGSCDVARTGLSRARDNEFPGAIAQAFSGMGEAARRAGNLAAANSYHREALARFEATGSVEGAVFSLACLGLIATSDGEPTAAIELLTTSLVRAVESSDRRGVAMAVEGLADAHAALGEASVAARMLGAADALRDEIGGAPPIVAARLRGSSRTRRSVDISTMPCTKRSMRVGGPTRTVVVAGLLSLRIRVTSAVSDHDVAGKLAEVLTPEHGSAVSLAAEHQRDHLDVLALPSCGGTATRNTVQQSHRARSLARLPAAASAQARATRASSKCGSASTASRSVDAASGDDISSRSTPAGVRRRRSRRRVETVSPRPSVK